MNTSGIFLHIFRAILPVTCFCTFLSSFLSTIHLLTSVLPLLCVLTGYGFVDFDSPAAAQKAVASLKASGVQAQMAKVNFSSTPTLWCALLVIEASAFLVELHTPVCKCQWKLMVMLMLILCAFGLWIVLFCTWVELLIDNSGHDEINGVMIKKMIQVPQTIISSLAVLSLVFCLVFAQFSPQMVIIFHICDCS